MPVCDDQPVRGRIREIGLFLLDDCLRPIYGPGAGYIDQCPAGLSTSDTIDEGEEFTKRCTDGSIRIQIPGVQTLTGIEVNADFEWIPPEFVAAAGGASPIIHNGETIGWSDCTRSTFNVAVVVWQEIVGGDACDPNAPDSGCERWVRVYPVKGARMTEDGDPGSEDNVIRLTGNTLAQNALGSGPIPLACDETTGEAQWLTDCLPSGCHRYQFIGAAPPDVCGVVDTVEPPTPCISDESPAELLPVF